jgi:hypothetical protein
MPGETFVSYSRADSAFALQVAKDLRASGAIIWLDQLDIKPGQRWDKSVEEALAGCPCMLIILSPDSVASTTVMDEVSFALEKGKAIIPVFHRECQIPFRLRRLQYVDFRNDYGNALTALLNAVTSAQPAASVLNFQGFDFSEFSDQQSGSVIAEDAGSRSRSKESLKQRISAGKPLLIAGTFYIGGLLLIPAVQDSTGSLSFAFVIFGLCVVAGTYFVWRADRRNVR